MTLANPDRAVVILPDGLPLDADLVHTLLVPHVTEPYALDSVYPVHRHGPRPDPGLLQPQHTPDGTVRAAAGPLSRLDLSRLAMDAYTAARARWHAWRHLVAANTPHARDWHSYLTEHQSTPKTLTLAQARRRFEAQPRVLTMLAVNGARTLPYPMDVDELDAYQAGETVYCTLAWQQSLVGQALVVPGGLAYWPVTDSIADRLRYLRAALDVVHALPPGRSLAALTRTS